MDSLKCTLCEKTFSRKSNLIRHSQTHLKPHHPCSICDKTFSRKDNLDVHMKRHLNEKNCLYCKKVFADEDYLDKHVCENSKKRHRSPSCNTPRKSMKYNPDEKYIITTEYNQISEKFNVSKTFYRVSFPNLEVHSLTDILSSLQRLFKNILKDMTVYFKNNDYVHMVLMSPQLDFPITLAFRQFYGISADTILNEIERVLQSNEHFILDSGVMIEMTHIKSPRGMGLRRKIVDIESMLRTKKSVIRIKNKDELCCARAIITAVARIEGHEKWKSIKLGQKIQGKLARDLHEKAEVPLSSCGIEEVKKFQQILPEYQINLVSKAHFNAIIYSGPEVEKKIYLYLNNSHYDVITKMAGFLSNSYFCTECNKGYSKKEKHKCNNVCRYCKHIHKKEENEFISCEKCKRKFNGKICLDRHLFKSDRGKSTCEIMYICECGVLVNKLRHQNKQPHRCGEKYCNVCQDFVLEGHKCYMKPMTEKRKENKVNKGIYIFFDFETIQDSMYECEKGYEPLENEVKCKNCLKSICGAFQHVPNYCVAQKVCQKCLNEDVNEESRCVECGPNCYTFSGDNTTENFCKWLFSDENKGSTVIAHNFKGYDSMPIINYLYDNGLKPEIIPNGSKNMCITVKQCNIRMIDSLNFIPAPLAKLPSMFGLKELTKGYFPYFFNKRENQHVIQKGLPNIEFYNPDSMKKEDRVLFMEWYDKHKNDAFNFKEELHKYCLSDVDILRKCCLKFRELFMMMSSKSDDIGIDPFEQCITIASACNHVFRKNFLKEDKIAIIPVEGYRPKDKYSVKALKWLKYLSYKENISIQHAHHKGEKSVGKYKLDGYYEEENGTKVALEFHGCFWHGCIKCFSCDTKNIITNKTMGELYETTLEKERFLKDLGYEYKSIWECEFDRQVKDIADMQDFINSLNIVNPLEPREAFYGGRTEAYTLQKMATENEKVKYYDVTSLYPYVNKTKKYPVGHPEIVTDNFKNIDAYEGLVKCKIIPPRNLYLPVLPSKIRNKLMFTLCRTCAENNDQTVCMHSEEERSLRGTWVTDEVKKAIEKGYHIKEIYEVWHFKETEQYDPERKKGGLFTEYIDTFLKLKQEASGWPAWCNTEKDKQKYIENYYDKEGIKLNHLSIKKNPGLRSLAKLMLNSFWGKFGQRLNMHQIKYVDDPKDLFDMLSSDSQEVTGLNLINKDMIELRWRYREDFVETSYKTNVIIAAYTTTHARLELYSYLEKLGPRTLYADTDSIIFSVKANEYEPPLGDYLGDLTNEIDKGLSIAHFVTGGPKNYAYRLSNNKEVCKIRGITLNFNNAQLINFNSINEMIRNKNDDVITVTDNSKIVIKEKKIFTKVEKKDYKIVFDKRIVQENLSTLPFGY